jgi:FkbM family methyltransferase
MGFFRLLLNRLIGRDTVVSLEAPGRTLRMSITTRRELRRLREVALEARLLERVSGALRSGDVLYDVGANIGVLTLLLATEPVGREVRIFAAEPEPGNFRQLERNVALNGLEDRVLPHRVALGAADGTTELFVRGGAGEGRHSIVEERGSTRTVQVPLSTLATFAERTGSPPDVVKIDVEGAEGRVLAGMEPLLNAGAVRDVFLELHPKGERDRMPGGEVIGEWMRARGYEEVWAEPRRSGRHCHFHRTDE